MLPTKRDQQGVPTTEVWGDFPVTYHYTVGISGEKFFEGLKNQKLVANTCNSCNKTYLPPKLFCEDCFDELTDDSYKEIKASGKLVSFTEVFLDHRGDKLSDPYFLALIQLNGTDTTFFHKLINTNNPTIGGNVTAVWNDTRSGSLFDLNGFQAE
ncbi:MAG: hypothetical protein IH840_05775 [Candidatus Heimdallarchaeota archaeon]|nr:hypothetical protein [Candidatus Heimdallarchaeota archaeon]